MAKLVFLRAIDLARFLSYSIFEGGQAAWTTNIGLNRLDFLEKFLPQSRHCSGKGTKGQMDKGRKGKKGQRDTVTKKTKRQRDKGIKGQRDKGTKGKKGQKGQKGQ